MPAEGNVGVAFALVAAAGMCTTIGACIVFCASLAQPRFLAGSLAFAAGVMLYVSFAEILMRKSIAGFEAVATDATAAYRWSTLCFFGGMAAVAVLDRLVHMLAHLGAKRSQRKAAAGGRSPASASTANLLSHEDQRNARRSVAAAAAAPTSAPAVPSMPKLRRGSGAGASAAAAGAGQQGAGGQDVENIGSAASTPRAAGDAGAQPPSEAGGSEAREGGPSGRSSVSTHLNELSAPADLLTEPCDAMTSAVVAASCPDTVVGGDSADKPGGEGEAAGGGTSSRTPPAVVELMEADHHAFMLKKMGVLTALALFIHNFPEGLATFVGALADTKIGVGLAVAIAMHNVPEGICVAMPIYYATGSKWKGFWWAFLSGVSEPVGGLVGYLALSGNNDLAFAIVFGLVAGMMVFIAIKELIPTALRYDPQDSVATTCVVLGMVVMAASLLLFTI
jgi:zinc transporter ZupT